MADYPVLAPTLAALAATETDPTGAESADKLNDSIVQTRIWLGDFLAVALANDGKLKPDAFGGSSIPAGVVRGSNPVGDVQREILQLSIRAIDIADGQITAAKLAAGAIATAAIADLSITTAKLAEDAVTASKIADGTLVAALFANGSVTTAAIADIAVTTGKLADKAVITAKINDRAVTGDKLPACPVGYIYVGGNVVNGIADSVVPKKVSGIMSVSADGVFSLNTTAEGAAAFALVAEKAATGVDGAQATANAWIKRGNTAIPSMPPWSIEKDTSGLVNVNGTRIEVKQDGTYLLEVSAPARCVTSHQIKAVIRKDGDSVDTETIYGTSEHTGATTNVTTRSFLRTIVSFSGATSTVFPYFEIEHFAEAANAGHSMGKAVAGANHQGPNYYAIVSILKLF